MTIKRIYNGKNYTSVQALRNEIFAQTGRIFGYEPTTDEERVSFWAEFDVTYEVIPPTPEEIEADRLDEAKRLRAAKVAAITVEVDGMVFDGDEMAQSRMARAVTAAETAGLDKTVWVLADNTVAEVTKAQLQQALSKAMLAMAAVWTEPYEGTGEEKEAEG